MPKEYFVHSAFTTCLYFVFARSLFLLLFVFSLAIITDLIITVEIENL